LCSSFGSSCYHRNFGTISAITRLLLARLRPVCDVPPIVLGNPLQRLSLSDFCLRRFRESPERYNISLHARFLSYAAEFWADHFRNSDWESTDEVAKMAVSYFNPTLPASQAWFEIYQTLAAKRGTKKLCTTSSCVLFWTERRGAAGSRNRRRCQREGERAW